MYPIVSERVKAAVYDGFILTAILVIIGQVIANSAGVSNLSKALILSSFLLYDPIATAFFGGTIGHRIVGIRVKRKSNDQKNINIFAALVRYVIKVILGVISLFTVTSRDDRAAIHDMMVGSIVVYG